MKATLRENGQNMFAFRVEYAIGVDDLQRVVVELLDPEGVPYSQLPITRQQILDAMRYRLKNYGPWDCGLWDEVETAQKDRASVIVKMEFPELIG